MAGHIRLGWWREQIDAIYAGRAVDTPEGRALADAMRAYALPREIFHRALDARALDFEETPFADEAAMEAHAVAVSGGITQLAMQVLGADSRADQAARNAGIARSYAGHIGSFAAFAQRRRCRAPLQWFEEAGLNAEDVFSARHLTPELRAVLDRTGSRALRALGDLNRARFPTAVTPALAPATLARWVARGFDPFAPRALPAWQRVARIAWSNLTWRF